MTNHITDLSQRKAVRVAGLLYLLVIVFGIIAEFFVRQSLIVPGDAAETAHNIMANEWLFRIGFVSDLIMITCLLLLALALYVVLKPVNKNIASLMVLIVLVGTAIAGINMLNQFAALILLSGADYLKVFGADQLHALAGLFLNLHEAGTYIAQILSWGPWLFPLGYLVFKSGYFPRILGVLLMIACFGFLIKGLQYFLVPDYEVITYPGIAVATIAEFSFCGWFLLKGAKIPSKDAD